MHLKKSVATFWKLSWTYPIVIFEICEWFFQVNLLGGLPHTFEVPIMNHYFGS